MRRKLTNWLVDAAFCLFAVVFSILIADSVLPADLSDTARAVEDTLWALACAAVFVRRRWPVALAVVLVLAGTWAHLLTGPTLVALFTVAAHRPPRVTAWVAAITMAPAPLVVVRQVLEPEPDRFARGAVYFFLILGSIGWGLYIRSRRQLIASLRERAERAAVDARRQAREDMAREMHDVLAHRLSLLSVHAGALEFHPGAPPAEVQRAAGVIRESAHQALQDLREVIGVLRRPENGDRPQPVLTDLERLAAESRAAGMSVALDQRVGAPDEAPPVAGRTAYRIVQEGLTNARKHAGDAPVTVTVSGGPGAGLTVEVCNPAPGGSPRGPIPGAGQGLIGLAERASLAGGRLEHRQAGDRFLLTAWLPWPG
ncbi:histidine kinase [Streptomyces sp. MP131-18]|uniref:sensor histidine kinase n=1 Tax=Streptomyces sp. MP131-18 TaxID=1857892 RepID=UPI00097CBAF4|nr:histidine kinase [Streptomyces sp. MP131-18]ONK10423.1 Nitrate/nitrite sensor protein NarX [Streptomyces sp. MP131-18]